MCEHPHGCVSLEVPLSFLRRQVFAVHKEAAAVGVISASGSQSSHFGDQGWGFSKSVRQHHQQLYDGDADLLPSMPRLHLLKSISALAGRTKNAVASSAITFQGKRRPALATTLVCYLTTVLLFAKVTKRDALYRYSMDFSLFFERQWPRRTPFAHAIRRQL